MLKTLTIKNVVLIDQMTVEFSAGFCALTGETGAGKSILLDSLGLALGGRSDAGLIRKGTDQASVGAVFDMPRAHPVRALLAEQGIDVDPGEDIVLRRLVGIDGRSRAFINDQAVSIGLLKQAGSLLVEIHGQFETHGLLDPSTHLSLLDDYAGVDPSPLANFWQAWKEAERILSAARDDAAKAKAEEDYLRHAVKELEEFNPQADEEQTLLARRETLKSREQILGALQESWQAISGDDGAELNTARAARNLTRIADKTGGDTAAAIGALDRAAQELQDAARVIEALTAALEEGGLSLESLEDRLYGLRGLARKYGCMPDSLTETFAAFQERLSLVTRQDDILTELGDRVFKARTAYLSAAETAHKKRKAAATTLDRLIARELPPLKLEKARFETRVDSADESAWGPRGMDRAQFLVATNPGADSAPLNKIASGGEMARFMLALKVVMADVGAAPSLIFDEVDSGLGGAASAAVGERLARLAGKRQILVVTHSPQVAARAQNHWIVMKQGQKDVTTNVIPLPEFAARQEEIARMLSGAKITDEARAAAQKLLETGS